MKQWIHSKASRDKAKAQGKRSTKLAKRKPSLYSVALGEIYKCKFEILGSNFSQLRTMLKVNNH